MVLEILKVLVIKTYVSESKTTYFRHFTYGNKRKNNIYHLQHLKTPNWN